MLRLKILNGFPNTTVSVNVLPASNVLGSRNDVRYIIGYTIDLERHIMGSTLFFISYDKI